jgi:hypothetical protein
MFKQKCEELRKVLEFFFLISRYAGIIEAGRVPVQNFFIEPETRIDTIGFWDFQPEPAKKGLKSARIGVARGGLARVGRIRRVLPTPNLLL